MNQWPQSYLNNWDAFIKDDKSIRYAACLFDHLFQKNDFLNGKDFLSIADIFSGTGHFGKSVKTFLKTKDIKTKLTFIDKSKDNLNFISLEEDEEISVNFITSMYDIEDCSKDIVVCRYGFNNLPKEEWDMALDESLRILKSGGILLIQDHFIPGETFSNLVNESEQFLAKMENKENVPFIYSTDEFNKILNSKDEVKEHVKVGYIMQINIWDRLRNKFELLSDFEKSKSGILDFYKNICLDKYKVLIVDTEEYIHVYNITYGIVKK